MRRRQTYIPYYYIGLARFRQGDCAGADEVWGQSESQGVVQGLAQARSIEHGRETCRLRADLAELLVANDGNHARAQELDEQALDIANSIGMKPLIRRILSRREILKA